MNLFLEQKFCLHSLAFLSRSPSAADEKTVLGMQAGQSPSENSAPASLFSRKWMDFLVADQLHQVSIARGSQKEQ